MTPTSLPSAAQIPGPWSCRVYRDETPEQAVRLAERKDTVTGRVWVIGNHVWVEVEEE